MLIPLKQGKPKKKKVDGKWYNWCLEHESWGIHLPSECKGKGYIPGKPKGTTKKEESNSSAPSKKKVKIAEALSSILMEDDM